MKKDEDQFVAENGRQALNFQISWTILLLIAGATILVGIGLFIVPILALIWLVLIILSTMTANGGEVANYELGGYPTKIDLI